MKRAFVLAEGAWRTAGVGASAAIDAVMPQICAACSEWMVGADGQICGPCGDRLRGLTSATCCPRCGRGMTSASIHEEGCARCIHESFWNVRRIVRVGAYDEPLRAMILALKYGGHVRHATLLGSCLADALVDQPWCAELEALVPVPMHLLRRLQRPCDHAWELAEACAKHLRSRGMRVRAQRSAVRRKTYGPSQTNLTSRNARFDNVRDHFKAAWRANVEGKTICIVDNLLVSGATLCEVSKVLRRAGAKRIYAAIVARAVLPGDFQAGAAPVHA